VNDYVGRCLAEAKVSDGVVAVTLTYRGDGLDTVLLDYSDVQKFLKRLRKAYSVRYIVAGEYGAKKGRAHWHCILFFKGAVPPVSFDRNFMWSFWPHGFSYFQRPDYGGFAYVLKYLLKGSPEGYSKRFQLSKKPPLGLVYLSSVIDEMIDRGIPLADWSYRFADVKDRQGRVREFFIPRGRVRDLVMDRYWSGWIARYGSWPPSTPAVDDYKSSLGVDDDLSLGGFDGEQEI